MSHSEFTPIVYHPGPTVTSTVTYNLNVTTNVVPINQTLDNFNNAESTLIAAVEKYNPSDISTVETYLNTITSDIYTEQKGYAANLVTDTDNLFGYLQTIDPTVYHPPHSHTPGYTTGYAVDYAWAVTGLSNAIDAFGYGLV